MLNFIKCFERVLIKIISDLFPDNIYVSVQHRHSRDRVSGLKSRLRLSGRSTGLPEAGKIIARFTLDRKPTPDVDDGERDRAQARSNISALQFSSFSDYEDVNENLSGKA
jgi:hypothetical protein